MASSNIKRPRRRIKKRRGKVKIAFMPEAMKNRLDVKRIEELFCSLRLDASRIFPYWDDIFRLFNQNQKPFV